MNSKEIKIVYTFPAVTRGKVLSQGINAKRTEAILEIVKDMYVYDVVILESRKLTTQSLTNALRQKQLSLSRLKFSIAKISNTRFAVLRIK